MRCFHFRFLIAIILFFLDFRDASALEVTVEKNVITITGYMEVGAGFETRDLSIVKNAIKENPSIKTINLENMSGGSTETAGLLFILFQEMDLSTVSTGLCASACSWIFLSGVNR